VSLYQAQEHPAGVIILFNDPDGSLPKDVNRKHVSFLLDQASLALDNAARYSFAKDLLYIDELTGLYNYRYLDVVLDRELKRSERYGSNLSVLFLDIDLFKMVNDMFGHLIGSRVLREVGTLVRKSVRDVDAVIRYGGDEYTVVLVETGLEGAAVVGILTQLRPSRQTGVEVFQFTGGLDLLCIAPVFGWVQTGS